MTRRPPVQAEYTFTRFEQACAKYPDHTAIIFLGDKFSYREPQGHGGSFCHRTGWTGS